MELFLLPLFILYLVASNGKAEQNYSANSVMSCANNDEKGPSSAFLYTCNGLNKSCLAFLIFKSQPPYNTIPAISNLTSSDPQELTTINHVTISTVFPTGKEVIVPVNCSCKTRDYYEAETTYRLPTIQTYFTIANDTYQGLSTCDSLKRYNPYGELDLHPGMLLHVPLRCACPTASQTLNGTNFLLTYPIYWGDNISALAVRFNVSESSLLDANGITTPTLFPFTTILIPLPSEPDSSTTIVHHLPPPAAISPAANVSPTNAKTKLYVAVSTSTGGFVVVLCGIWFSVFVLRKKSQSARLVEEGTNTIGKRTKWTASEDIREEIASIEDDSKEYRLEEIKKATENFSSKNRIQGCVYRGVFGKDILVVKKMSADASKEVNMLKKINHFNLIKLRGYCKHEGFFYLVLEYMENGSLREWLRKKSMSTDHQSWSKRIQIALDIANGLQYLHNFTEPCYVHKDINTSNILLNKNARAKIANFSLALAKESQGKTTCTSHVVGTRGYMAPEYMEAGMVSPQMDVYAFGVVLLELITGKDCVIVEDGREVMLSAVIVSLMANENAEANLGSLVDPNLSGYNGKALAGELAKLSVACLLQEPASRPSMADIVSSLLKIQASVHLRISPSKNCDSPRLPR
ncbi:lysM domain receptor-like kinase 4 [Senna tora]|uniref:LysM domain receptor-like kinase 4 n=1 Tax=Senna tora TaxID=362788 RepID=A0A834WE25_9FABA|nr:lysM domain receptor-like kinase 4 [Senna tora]